MRHDDRVDQAADLEAEARSHLEALVEQHEREGMLPGEARLAAQRAFGGLAQLAESCHDERRLPALEDVARDVRVAIRQLRRSPGVLIGVVLTLGLGVAATTIVFTWMTAVLSAAAPIRDMDRLVGVWLHNRSQGETKAVVAPGDFDAWVERQNIFDRVVAQDVHAVNLSGADTPVRVQAAAVNGDYFSVFSATPMLGRGFGPADERLGAPPVCVIGHRFWTDRFGADPAVLGRIVRVNDVPTTVIGVLPRNDYSPELLLPLQLDPKAAGYRERRLFVSARLKDGITVEQAGAVMTRIGDDLERSEPDHYRGWSINVRPLQEEFVGPQARLAFALLFATTAVVLIIGCANIANLMLSRGVERARELALRTALGASRARLMRQLLVEGLVMASGGAIVGLMASGAGLAMLRATFEAGAPYMERARLSVPALGFALAVTVTATLLFALVPALIATRRVPASALRDGGHTTGGHATQRLRRALVTSEVALAALLVLVAVLFGRGLLALRQIRPGFEPDRVLTLRVSLPPTRFDSNASVVAFHDRALERLRALPGAEAAGATTRLPAAGSRFNPNRSVNVEGRSPGANETWFANDLTISPGYLETLRVPLRSGRHVGAADRAESPLVVVVSEALVRESFGGNSPLGAHLRLGDEPAGQWRTVVGVVGDVRNDDIDAPPVPTVYVPLAQRASRDMTMVLRTAGEPHDVVAAARSAIAQVDQDLPVYEVRTLNQVLDEDLRETVVLVGLAALFGATALLLAATGIYAVLAHDVAQATREIGIRLALGGTRLQVMRGVTLRGLMPVAVGLVLGTAAGAAVGRIAGSLLYGVSAGDVSNYAVTVGVLAAVAIVACAYPTWRAARTSPLEALRCD